MIARRSALSISNRLKLQSTELTEVPSKLFRMKNVTCLALTNNKLCSLPSDIAHLTMLKELRVRLSKRLDRDLTKIHGRSSGTGSRLFHPSSVG
jgi:Leucine-rich repeat (LRR) protein